MKKRKTIKFKKPKPITPPKAPELSDIRGGFAELNKQLREARYKYIDKAWAKADKLTGYTFILYLRSTAKLMIEAGLYSPTYNYTSVTYALARWFYRADCRDTGAKYWKEWQARRGFHIWDLSPGRRPLQIKYKDIA